MPETGREIVRLLHAAIDALSTSQATDRNALSTAGAALEEAVEALPHGVPGVGTVLSLALEALEGAYTGALDRANAISAVGDTLRAALRGLDAPADASPTEAADGIGQAGRALWALLARDPGLSPFAEPRPSASTGRASITERLATLISLDPEDTPELANLAAWLVERAEDASLDDAAREAADRARELVCRVLDGSADDPAQALDEAAEALSEAAEPPPASPPAEEADEPACLQFAGDAALLAEFIAEALDHLRNAEAGMLALEIEPGDGEAVNAVFRAFHTIKGAAGFLGLATVQELAHRAENLLVRVREGELRLTEGHADLALESADALRQMLEDLAGWQDGPLPEPPREYDELLGRLSARGVGCAGAPVRPSVEAGASAATAVAQAPRRRRNTAQNVAEGTVRVGTGRLDSLINMVGELVIANAMLAQDEELRERSGQEVVRKIDQISKITRELQDVTMSLRMVPLSATFQRMARLVRDLSRKSGKQVELLTEGEDTEIDRNMVEAISDPLLHMVRNAVDHGIESPQERREAGKPPTGTVVLRAYHAAGSVAIELEDDGRGLDRKRIRAKAVRDGVIAEDAQLSDEEIFRLIFAAGLSTAEQVTDVSGRGVGMDVVRRNIEALRGRIEIASTPGEGTVFTARVPLTLAIIDGMLLRVGAERYILPTISILRAVRPEPGSVSSVSGRGEMIDLQGELLPVLRLHDLLGIDGAPRSVCDGLVVVTESGGAAAALLVDELLGQQQIVIKSLGDGLGNVPGVSGAAILGDGSVGLILDVDGLLRIAHSYEGAYTAA
ncbi:MAG: chemotaxis protein CheA [Armatimonadota bacterium]|jgi:two-component system chemotaxis sensor kinase CheA